jgi:uncharacterized protein
MMRISVFVFLLIYSTCILAAQCSTEKSLIHVSGTGEVRAVPDEVTLRIGMENFAKDTATSKAQNEAALKSVLAAIQSAGVDPRDYQTSNVSVAPRYKRGEDSQPLLGYVSKVSVTVKLRNLERLSDLNLKALAAGATSFEQDDYSTSKLAALRSEARALAIKAAREKAEFLAAQLGQKIGKAFAISTESAFEAYRTGGLSNAYAYSGGGGGGGNGQTIATGVIPISETVNVSFELQ